MRRIVIALAALVVALVAGCGSSDDGQKNTANTMGGMDMSGGSTMDVVGDGRSATQDGYTLADVSYPPKAGTGVLSFHILDKTGKPHLQFAFEQTKLMHVYVVRSDLGTYDHVHPLLGVDGRWLTPLTLETPGKYRLVTEFIASDKDGHNAHLLLGKDITIPGRAPAPPAKVAAAPVAEVDGYQLRLTGHLMSGMSSKFTIRITKGGKDVSDLQPYLDSYAHLTGFRFGDLATVHVHPMEPVRAGKGGGPELTFDPMFKAPGNYRFFVQFQTGGKLHTAPLTVSVS